MALAAVPSLLLLLLLLLLRRLLRQQLVLPVSQLKAGGSEGSTPHGFLRYCCQMEVHTGKAIHAAAAAPVAADDNQRHPRRLE